MKPLPIIFITGASSGIGKSIGIYLTEKGCKVYGTARNPDQYKDFNHFRLLALDVSKPDTIQAAVNEVLSLSGRIDVLINNAGVGITGPLEETPYEAIDHCYDTNFKGPMRVIEAVLPAMRKQQSGLIINITSIAGAMGLPYRGIYSASKASLSIITETYSMELKPFGIKCCSLAPGDFATNIAAGRYHVAAKKTSPYHPFYQQNLDQMNAHVSAGSDPIEVAKSVYKIMNTKQPKVHYVVGSPLQKFSLVLKKLLPSKVFEKMLSRHYNL
jgi:NAD(P)-dependent dehydrogenase (short-subunit alcohol dehydrogenase family)